LFSTLFSIVNGKDISKLLQEYSSQKNIVGISVGIVDKEGIHFYNEGSLSAGKDLPISENTIFEIASISKVFTSLLLQKKIEKGDYLLDDELEIFLPSHVNSPKFLDKKITLKHLVTHTSALPYMPINTKIPDMNNPFAGYTIEKLYNFLNNLSVVVSTWRKI